MPGADPGQHTDNTGDFEAFYHRHHEGLARLAWLVTGEEVDAADVAAEALASAWQHWNRVRASRSPDAYVRRATVNIATSRIRTRVRDRRRLTALMRRCEAAVFWSPDTDTAHDLRAALATLPTGRRACLVLRYAFDLSEQEVADTLQISVGTVKSQTARAAAQLRRQLTSPAPAPTVSPRPAPVIR